MKINIKKLICLIYITSMILVKTQAFEPITAGFAAAAFGAALAGI